MKFSYTLLKGILGKLPPKEELINRLNLHVFEAEDAGGDTIEVSLTPNRYSDAASHAGIAREIAAILNIKKPKGLAELAKAVKNPPMNKGFVRVLVEDKTLAPRYSARYFEIKKIGEAPQPVKA